MPTIKDVARAAGVSIATVSYVLNNKLDMVSEETRQHVLKTAQRLEYRPNVMARALQASRTGLIGYAWHNAPGDSPNWVMAQFMYHLAQAVEMAGYHMLTFTHPIGDPIAVYEDLIRSGRLDGFILAETKQDDPRVAYLLETNVPFVSFGRTNNDWEFSWVDTDGCVGMRSAVEYLAQIGHERIAFMGWPPDSLSGNDRLRGYIEGMEQAKLPIADRFVIQSDYNNGIIETILTEWQELPSDIRPTAVIAVTDFVAIGIVRAAERHGFQIGKTLSVIGFDGAPIGQFIQPALTTLYQPMQIISQKLLEFFQEIAATRKTVHQSVLVAPKLIIRESTGSPQIET